MIEFDQVGCMDLIGVFPSIVVTTEVFFSC